MPNIHIEIKNRIAYANKEDFVVGGNEDYKAIFTFDEEWKDVETKTARFSWGFDNMHDEVFVGNECEVPRITNATILKVGIFIGNKRATTDAFVPCKISTVDNNGMPPNPENDVYTQILKKLDEAIGEQTAVPKGGKQGQVLTKGSDKDFDTEWADGGSGGGTNVEANPTEEATQDLSKLKVGDKVYDVVDKTELDKKLDKPTVSVDSVLGIQANGTTIMRILGSRPTSVQNGGVPQYQNYNTSNTVPNVRILTGTPQYDGEATNKKYVDDKFNGSNKAVSFVNYSSMITSLNSLASTSYNVSQDIMIVTLKVPDLWISEITETSVPYTYVSDDDFVSELETNGFVQVGYFKLSALETQKVDLTEYVKQTQIAQQNGGYGLVKLANKGLVLDEKGNLAVGGTAISEITAQNNGYKAITTELIALGVKNGLINPDISRKPANWTTEEQALAMATLGKTAYMHVFALRSNQGADMYRVYLVMNTAEPQGFSVFKGYDTGDEVSFLISGWDYDNGVLNNVKMFNETYYYETSENTYVGYGIETSNGNLLITEENFTLISEKVI